MFNDEYVSILTCNLAHNEQDIFTFYDDYLSMNYEGAMVKKIAYPYDTDIARREAIYRPNRCSNILKLKPSQDEEGTIVAVENCKGRETDAARFVLKLDTEPDEPELYITVRMKGAINIRKYWFENAKLAIGLRMTYKFMGKSETGVPRHPVGKAIRDYE